MNLGVPLAAQGSTNTSVPAVLALIGVLGGAIIGVLSSLATTMITQKVQRDIVERNIQADREKELRQERQKSYRQYWAREYEFRRTLYASRQADSEMDSEIAESVNSARLSWEQAYSDVQLLGGSEVGNHLSIRVKRIRLLDSPDGSMVVNDLDEQEDFRQSATNLMWAMQAEIVQDES
jgi:hypothetical protein